MSQPFTLHIDASADALGATLSQPDRRGHLRLLTCTSRKLNTAERNYPTHEREMLALVHALKKLLSATGKPRRTSHPVKFDGLRTLACLT